MADDDDQPPTLPGFEHLRPVAVVKDDASPTVRRTAQRRERHPHVVARVRDVRRRRRPARRRRPRIAQGPGAGAGRVETAFAVLSDLIELAGQTRGQEVQA